MTHPKVLEGKGRLRIGDRDLGPADYWINVFRVGHRPVGEGTISAEPDALKLAFDFDDPAILVLEDGNTVQINVTHWQPASNETSVTTSGSIPGF